MAKDSGTGMGTTGIRRDTENYTYAVTALNGALHDLIAELISRGEVALLLTHPNSTIRETAKSYLRKDDV